MRESNFLPWLSRSAASVPFDCTSLAGLIFCVDGEPDGASWSLIGLRCSGGVKNKATRSLVGWSLRSCSNTGNDGLVPGRGSPFPRRLGL